MQKFCVRFLLGCNTVFGFLSVTYFRICVMAVEKGMAHTIWWLLLYWAGCAYLFNVYPVMAQRRLGKPIWRYILLLFAAGAALHLLLLGTDGLLHLFDWNNATFVS